MRLISPGPGGISPTIKTAPDTGPAPSITVRLFGSIRAAAGKDHDVIEIAPDCMFFELMRFISRAYGDEFKFEIFQEAGDDLRDDLIVSIDGVITEHNKLKNLQLINGAVVTLLPNFSGGG